MSKAGELKANIAGAVARGWCSKENECKAMDSTLAYAIVDEVMPIVTALQERLKQAEEVIKDLNKYADKKGLSSLMFMQRVINRLEKYKDDKGE